MEQSVLRFDMDLRCFPRGEGLELGGRVQGRAVSAKCQVLQSDAEVSGQMLLTSNARVNIKILIGEHCRYRFLICSSPFLVPSTSSVLLSSPRKEPVLLDDTVIPLQFVFFHFSKLYCQELSFLVSKRKPYL
jgi:hypothetical protein